MENLDTNINPKLDTTDETTEQTAERFVIDSEDRANWFLGKLAAIESEKARIKAQCAARLAELDADANRLHSRFDSELEAFARTEADKRKRKTVTLLQGSLSFRSVPASLKIEEEGIAFLFADEHAPHLIQTKRDLDKASYLKAAEKHLNETGETLPGVLRSLPREAFSVKFPGDKSDKSEKEKGGTATE